jgi:hypothetical protein
VLRNQNRGFMLVFQKVKVAIVQTGSGAHPASCTMGTGGSFPGGKARPGRDADHSPPFSAEVKKEEELYLLSPIAPLWSVAGPLNFLFYFTSCNLLLRRKCNHTLKIGTSCDVSRRCIKLFKEQDTHNALG